MAPWTPRAPADTDLRPVLELLRNSWMLTLRADGKSGKTLKTYRESGRPVHRVSCSALPRRPGKRRP